MRQLIIFLEHPEFSLSPATAAAGVRGRKLLWNVSKSISYSLSCESLLQMGKWMDSSEKAEAISQK